MRQIKQHTYYYITCMYILYCRLLCTWSGHWSAWYRWRGQLAILWSNIFLTIKCLCAQKYSPVRKVSICRAAPVCAVLLINLQSMICIELRLPSWLICGSFIAPPWKPEFPWQVGTHCRWAKAYDMRIGTWARHVVTAYTQALTFKVAPFQHEVIWILHTIWSIKSDLHSSTIHGCVVYELRVSDGDVCHGRITAIQVHVDASTTVLSSVALEQTPTDIDLRLRKEC